MDAQRLDALLGASPAEREESWRYSRNALRALTQAEFAPAAAASALPAELLARFDWPATRGRRLVFVNGAFAPQYSDPSDASIGIAHDATGARVTLRAGAAGALHLVYAHVPGAAATLWQTRLEVDVQGGAVDLAEHHIGLAGADALGALETNYRIAAGATLRSLLLSDLPDSCSLIRRQHATLGAAAALDASVALFGGRLQRAEIGCDLGAERARCELRGVFAPGARQHVDVQLDVRHAGRDTACDVRWRGVADQRGRGILRGAITVAAGADGADAALTTKNLLLSPHAEIDAQPVLEIHADEVKASHGATVGQLDERALFYLRSRGVPAATARAMLIAGFCREALQRVAPAFAAHVEAALAARLPRVGAEP